MTTFPLYLIETSRNRNRKITRVHTRKEYIGKVVALSHLVTYGKADIEMHISEKSIEQQLVKAVKSAGGIAPKFVSPGFDGMPDRLILLPKGHLAFAELKSTGKKPRPLQVARHQLLTRLGYQVFVIDSPEGLDDIIKKIVGEENGI
jgi:hypothetical protein